MFRSCVFHLPSPRQRSFGDGHFRFRHTEQTASAGHKVAHERVIRTAEDLKELGVRALGDRRILLNAIDALGGEVGAQSPSVAAAPALPSTAPLPSAPLAETAGERRHIAVMFCDLVVRPAYRRHSTYGLARSGRCLSGCRLGSRD